MSDVEYAKEVKRKQAAGIPLTQPLDTAAYERGKSQSSAVAPAVTGGQTGQAAYQRVVSDYFGGSPEAYAAEISRKESAGIPLGNPQAASQFKAAFPDLFKQQPTTTKSYERYVNMFGSPEAYAAEIKRKEGADIPLTDTAAAEEFKKAFPGLFGQGQAVTAQVPSGYVPVRDYAEALGYKVGWTGTAPTIGGIPLEPGKFVNIGGKTYAFPQYLDEMTWRSEIPIRRGEREDILSQIREQMAKPFNPEEYPQYNALIQWAQQQGDIAARQALEDLNRRGIVNSTVAADRVAQARQNAMIQILPTILQQAYGIRQDEIQNLFNLLGIYGGLEEQAYKRSSELEQKVYDRAVAAQEAELEKEKQRLEAEEKRIKAMWDRVENLGYVDNEASVVLNVPVGTLAADVRKNVQDNLTKIAIAKMNNEANLQRVRESNAASLQRTLLNLGDMSPTEQVTDLRRQAAEGVQSRLDTLWEDYAQGGGVPQVETVAEDLKKLAPQILSKVRQDLAGAGMSNRDINETIDVLKQYISDATGVPYDMIFPEDAQASP
jgi:hypothetical protein